MNNIELVEEFLNKKNLDGIDKFLLEKYIKATENLLEAYKQDEKMIDKICSDIAMDFGYDIADVKTRYRKLVGNES